jgi:hypothetical protein
MSSTTPSNSSNSLEELAHLSKPSETIKFKLLKKLKTSSKKNENNNNKSIDSICNKTPESDHKSSDLIQKSSNSINKNHFDCDDLFGNSMSYNITKSILKKNNYVNEILIRNYDNNNIITNSSSNHELNDSNIESKKVITQVKQSKSNDSKTEPVKDESNLKTVFQDAKLITSKNNNRKSSVNKTNRPNIYDNNVNNRKNIYILKNSDLKSKSCERIDELGPAKNNNENFSYIKNENEKTKFSNKNENNGVTTKLKNNENTKININLNSKKLNYSKSLKFIQTNSDDLNDGEIKSIYTRKSQNISNKINSIEEPSWKEIAFKKHSAWYALIINHFL